VAQTRTERRAPPAAFRCRRGVPQTADRAMCDITRTVLCAGSGARQSGPPPSGGGSVVRSRQFPERRIIPRGRSAFPERRTPREQIVSMGGTRTRSPSRYSARGRRKAAGRSGRSGSLRLTPVVNPTLTTIPAPVGIAPGASIGAPTPAGATLIRSCHPAARIHPSPRPVAPRNEVVGHEKTVVIGAVVVPVAYGYRARARRGRRRFTTGARRSPSTWPPRPLIWPHAAL